LRRPILTQGCRAYDDDDDDDDDDSIHLKLIFNELSYKVKKNITYF
jgi:hypothetical protein